MPSDFTDKKRLKTIVMIVQSLPPLPSGGAEMQALKLSAIIKKEGLDVLFITPGQGRIKGRVTIDGIPVYRLHSFFNYFLDLLFVLQKKTRKRSTIIEFDDRLDKNTVISRKIGLGARLRYNIFLINAYFFLRKKRKTISVLHSHTIEWPGYVASVLSKWLGLKLIIKDSTMNGILNILRFPSGEKKRELIVSQAHFVAMTKVIKENFIKAGIRPDKISEIPNGLSIGSQHKTIYRSTARVLFVGNLYQQPAKGVDILLKSWQTISIKFPKATLWVAGDGDLEAFRTYVKEKGLQNSVTFLGKQNDVPALMLEADLFVLPSRREGMPNALMEAMLRAIPCVATDISGSQDIITHGKNGFLVPAADSAALADGIAFMLDHRTEAEQMGILGRETILKYFNITDVAKKYIALYEKI